MLVTLFLSIIVDIEWDIFRLAASVNFSTGVTVPVVFHSDKWSTNAVVVFVVICGIIILSRMRTAWGLALFWLNAVWTRIVKCGKWMRPYVVSMTTLLCLMKCNPIIGPVRIFITTNCSPKMWPPISNSSVAIALSFSNWPFATWIWKLGGSSILRILHGACCLILSSSFWAIALTYAPESTRASIVKSFSKSRGTHNIFFRFRLIVEVSGM